MPALQVKDCPADIYEQLRACAAQENRSISQQTLVILKEYLERRNAPQDSAPARPARVVSLYANKPDDVDYLSKFEKTLERIRKLPPIPVTDKVPSTVEILAQIREEEAR